MGAVSDINSKPRLLFCFAFFLIVAYIPGIIGAAIPTGWLYLIAFAPLLVVSFCEIELNNSVLMGLLFLLYCAVSLSWTINSNIGFFFLMQLAALGCVFIIGQNLVKLDLIFKGLAIGLGISDLLAVAQKYFDFKLVFFEYYTAAGLFVNPNIFSEVSVVILIGLVILKLWNWIPLALPGLLLVQSRAALVSLGVCSFIWFYKKNKLHALLSVLTILLFGYIAYRHDFRISSIQERYYLWMDSLQGFRVFGNGIGSFELLYPWNATHIDTLISRPRFAHNDLIHLIFELGIGSVLVLFMIFNILKINRSERIILYAIGIISLFSFPLHVPVLAFVGAIVAGNISRYDTNRFIWNNSRLSISSRS